MSDLSRLLDDVYQNGPAAPAPKPAAPAPAPAPAASAPPAPAPAPDPAPEAELAWDSSERLDEAFSDWVPGPTADSPQAERDLFDFGDEEPAAPTVLQHVFADDTPPMAADDPLSELSDLFDEEPVAPAVQAPVAEAPAPAPAPVAEAPAPAPAPVAEAPAPVAEAPAPAPVAEAPAPEPQAVQPQVAEHRVAQVVEAPAPRHVPARPLAYEPPMSLAEALGEAPDAPTADLLGTADVMADPDASWPLAGFAPAPVEAAPVDADADAAGTGLATSWRREHDDLLPARGGRRRR